MSGTESVCACGHPFVPHHLTPGAECRQSGAPDGCQCVTYKPDQVPDLAAMLKESLGVPDAR